MARKIEDILPRDSWAARWLQCWPVSEAPKSFLLFAGLAMVGAAIGRRAWTTLDIHRSYPMLNCLFLGPSGIGKSTAIKTGIWLKQEACLSMEVMADATTPEMIHKRLCDDPRAIILAEELAAFFGKQRYLEGMIPYVTLLLDYKSELQRGLKSEGVKTVFNPEVTILGGSTIEWLQDQLPDTAATGGFLPRFLIVKEDHKGQKIANPELRLGRAQRAEMESLRRGVAADLAALSAQGDFGDVAFLDYSVADVYADWYHQRPAPADALAPFAARASEWVRRLAMIMALTRGEARIRAQDIEVGIGLYNYTEKKLAEALTPFTPRGRILNTVLEAVPPGGMGIKTLYRNLRSLATARELRELVDSLIESGDVEKAGNEVRRIRKG